MIRRAAMVATLASLLLSACDQNPSSSGTPATNPSVLVGSWVASANDYSIAHMVLRPDGKVITVADMGSRRTLGDASWYVEEDTLFCLASGTTINRRKFELHDDSLYLITRYVSWQITSDTVRFAKEAEPNLVATSGTTNAEIVGNWIGAYPVDHTSSSGNAVEIHDTLWYPERFVFHADGTGENLTYDSGYVYDTIPQATAKCDGRFYCLLLPPATDCEATGTCLDTFVQVSHLDTLVQDSARFSWWIGGSNTLYIGVWNPYSKPQSAANLIAYRVFVWRRQGDALELQVTYGDFTKRRFTLAN